MSEEQLSAFLAKLQEDAGLREKLKNAVDIDAAVAIAREAGFDLTSENVMTCLNADTVELTNSSLEIISGGAPDTTGGGGTCAFRCDTNGINQESRLPCKQW
jgi:predicted ribosomally synthesized peptide with nif11-like leader